MIKTERGLACLRWESAHILTADEIKAARDLYDIQSREFEIAFTAAVSRIDV